MEAAPLMEASTMEQMVEMAEPGEVRMGRTVFTTIRAARLMMVLTLVEHNLPVLLLAKVVW